ncbi:50S ribosomal protein L25 [Paenibacillus donghaensis]|nr:50S ribosomal protein L25 [Paenibacillus donghaensis]
MSKIIQLNVRAAGTKSDMKAARHAGRIPAVLYGVGKETVSVEVNEKEMLEMLRKNPRAILQGKVSDEKVVPVIVQNIQKDSMSGKIKHIDFQHVNMSVSMDSNVTIHYAGEPVGVKNGGVQQVEIYEVQVRCMPDVLPTSMEVDISGLDVGGQLLVSDLVFVDGIEVLTDPATVMIQIKLVQEEVEEDAAAPAATVTPA